MTKGTTDYALQRQVVQRLGRSSVGLAAVVTGVALHRDGRMSLSYPQSPSESGRNEELGQISNSVLIGPGDGNQYWASLERLSPLGNLVILGGYINELWEGGQGVLGTAGGAAGSILTTVSEQSSLSGLKDFLQGVEEGGNRFTNVGRRMAGSVVPTIVSHVAQATDPYRREADTAIEHIQRRVPGLSRRLEPRLGPLGEPSPSRSGLLPMIDMFYSSRDRSKDDLLRNQLAETGAKISRRQIKRGDGETRAQYNDRIALEGIHIRSALVDLIQSPEYESPEDVRPYVLAAVRQGNHEAALEMAQRERARLIQSRITRERGRLTNTWNAPREGQMTLAQEAAEKRRLGQLPWSLDDGPSVWDELLDKGEATAAPRR